ncbi:MAG: hypothetical protein R3286_07775 [Gammaproteobacteria bacterium]|nr:hypothetical protein [Gammaproteobacteria bacterium]
MSESATESTATTCRGRGHVEQRVYATLVGSVPVRGPEQELCRKLASLAQVLYEQRDLSEADIDEILAAFPATPTVC